jgi:hypothetical protein
MDQLNCVCALCANTSEGLKVPTVLGHAHHRLAGDLEACLDLFGVAGFILMEFPLGGVLYQGPAKECRLEDLQHCALSIHMAQVRRHKKLVSIISCLPSVHRTDSFCVFLSVVGAF